MAVVVIGLTTLLVASGAIADESQRACQDPALKGDKAAWMSGVSMVRSDPSPQALAANSHFVVSDEQDHGLFHKDLDGIGGVLLGVGTDQNYLMAGWARSDFLVLLDFDQVVVDLHQVYGILFLEAGTPRQFQGFWSASHSDTVTSWIERDIQDPKARARVLRAYRMSRNLVEYRLRALAKRYREWKIPTFLTDDAQYTHVVRLWREGRVLAIRGDLTGDKAMRDVAELARAAGVPVRVLYLSNAETYFEYNDAFRQNIRAMPRDERSLVLRTSMAPDDPWAVETGYRYFVQSTGDFVEWLDRTGVKKVGTVRGRRVKGDTQGLYRLKGPKPPGPSIRKGKQQ
jgi:hypothetical protein